MMLNTPEYAALSNSTDRPRKVEASNLRGISEEEAQGDVALLYEHFREQFGREDVPGILQCFATHPPLLRHMMALSEDLIFSEGYLGRQHKEMIATLVSSLNACPYCADSHGFFLQIHGGSEAALLALLANDLGASALTGQQQTLLTFAAKVNNASQEIEPGDVEVMRVAGWTDPQIAEVIHITALFATFNRVANAFGLKSQGLLDLYRNNAKPIPSEQDNPEKITA
jgi:uncharacterized peroxidase-related enzyme